MSSGDWLLLSKECLCQVWTKWIPRKISCKCTSAKAFDEIALPETGSITIRDTARFFWDRGMLCLQHIPHSSQETEVVLNRRKVIISPIYKGDRVVLFEQEYQYCGDCLIPAIPLHPPKIVLQDIEIPGRLHIPHLCLEPGNFIGIIGKSGQGKPLWSSCSRGGFVRRGEHLSFLSPMNR